MKAEVKEREEDSHTSTFAYVYVNAIGQGVFQDQHPAFPVGTVIVRENLLAPSEGRPRMLTVMTKRAKGFNPAGGDWEFMLIDEALTQTQLREKTGNCQACHATRQESDFVFRTYLPQFNPRRKQ